MSMHRMAEWVDDVITIEGVGDSNQRFQMVRFVQTGKSSKGDRQLVLRAFERFGEIQHDGEKNVVVVGNEENTGPAVAWLSSTSVASCGMAWALSFAGGNNLTGKYRQIVRSSRTGGNVCSFVQSRSDLHFVGIVDQ
jgi:hypothetical protein